jgi:hypothetical protein
MFDRGEKRSFQFFLTKESNCNPGFLNPRENETSFSFFLTFCPAETYKIYTVCEKITS